MVHDQHHARPRPPLGTDARARIAADVAPCELVAMLYAHTGASWTLERWRWRSTLPARLDTQNEHTRVLPDRILRWERVGSPDDVVCIEFQSAGRSDRPHRLHPGGRWAIIAEAILGTRTARWTAQPPNLLLWEVRTDRPRRLLIDGIVLPGMDPIPVGVSNRLLQSGHWTRELDTPEALCLRMFNRTTTAEDLRTWIRQLRNHPTSTRVSVHVLIWLLSQHGRAMFGDAAFPPMDDAIEERLMTITRQYTGYQELEDELQEIARRRAEERKRFQDAIALAESLKTELAARDEEVSRLDEVNRQDRQALAQTIEARDHALALAEQQTELAERAAAARLRAEDERQRAEDERQRAEAQRQRTEDELQRTADERQRAEEERQRAEEERQRVADGIRRAVERRLLALGDRLPADVRTRIAAMSDPLEALEALEGWLERLLNEATESAVRRDGAQ